MSQGDTTWELLESRKNTSLWTLQYCDWRQIEGLQFFNMTCSALTMEMFQDALVICSFPFLSVYFGLCENKSCLEANRQRALSGEWSLKPLALWLAITLCSLLVTSSGAWKFRPPRFLKQKEKCLVNNATTVCRFRMIEWAIGTRNHFVPMVGWLVEISGRSICERLPIHSAANNHLDSLVTTDEPMGKIIYDWHSIGKPAQLAQSPRF